MHSLGALCSFWPGRGVSKVDTFYSAQGYSFAAKLRPSGAGREMADFRAESGVRISDNSTPPGLKF